MACEMGKCEGESKRRGEGTRGRRGIMNEEVEKTKKTREDGW